MTTMTISGKTAFITGASSGIGLAIAQRYATEGVKVVLSDVDVEKGEREAKAIRDSGGEALFIACDHNSISRKNTLASIHALAYVFLNALVSFVLDIGRIFVCFFV